MCEKIGRTIFVVVATRDESQGACSYQFIFNVYINILAVDIETSASAQSGEMSIWMLGHDVLLQSRLQHGWNVSMKIAKNRKLNGARACLSPNTATCKLRRGREASH